MRAQPHTSQIVFSPRSLIPRRPCCLHGDFTAAPWCIHSDLISRAPPPVVSSQVGLGHPRAAVLLRNLGSAAAGRASAAATVGRGSTTSTTELAKFRDGKGKGFLPPAYRA